MPDSAAATIHLAVAVQSFAWIETFAPPISVRPLDPAIDDLSPLRAKVDVASFPILDTPGLGAEGNEELAKKQVWAL